MAIFHTTLEVGQVLLIPAGSGASIELLEKSGRKARFKVTSNTPVTVAPAGPATPVARAASPLRLPGRPMPSAAVTGQK